MLFVNRDMERVERHRVAGGEVVAFSRKDAGREGPNQDAAAIFAVDERRAVLAVADGVGGQPGGELASGIALRTLGAALDDAVAAGTNLRNAVLTGIENANRAVRGSVAAGASTLAVAKIEDGRLRPFHVGDSLVAVVGQRGRRKLETISHAPVAYAVEAGLIDENEAMHHEERHILSNAIGYEDMRLEVGPSLALAARDTVLLATDGLLDNLFMEEILTGIRTGRLEKSGQKMADACLARMGGQAGKPSKPDDVTFLAYRRWLRREA